MGNRFGRRQKKTLKARIAQLEIENQRWKQAHRDVLASTAQERAIIQKVAKVLGNYFIALPPQEIETLNPALLRFDVPFLSMNTPDPLERVSNKEMAFVAESMPVIEFTHHQAILSKQAHMVFIFQGKRVGYGVMPQAVQLLGRDTFVQSLANEVARYMVESFFPDDENLYI